MAFFNSVEPHETSTDTSTLNNILFTPCCDLSFSMAQLNMAHNINQSNRGEQNLQIAQLDKINLVD